jgi:hypothetical protein
MNNWLWAIGLLLQCTLLMALVKRGVARRLPLFTLLIGLYVLRSVFLFAAFGHLSAAAYTLSITALSLIDVALQVLVAWELFIGSRQNSHSGTAQADPVPGSLLRRLAAFCALVALSTVMAWGISRLVPANPRSPIDRAVLLPSILMLMVAAVTASRSWHSRASVPVRVLAGFAVLGAAGILSQIGRALAALHREPRSYTGWSYTDAFAYLAVLVVWLGAVYGKRQPSPSLDLRLKRNAASSRPRGKKKYSHPKRESQTK